MEDKYELVYNLANVYHFSMTLTPFLMICRYSTLNISETVQDRDMVTMEY